MLWLSIFSNSQGLRVFQTVPYCPFCLKHQPCVSSAKIASFSEKLGVEFISPNIISAGVSHSFPTYNLRKIWSFLRHDSSDLISTSTIVWVWCVLEEPVSLRIKTLNCSGCWEHPSNSWAGTCTPNLNICISQGSKKEMHHLLLLSVLSAFPGGLI